MQTDVNYQATAIWDRDFSKRRTIAYAGEDEQTLEFRAGDKGSLIAALCEPRMNRNLHPPDEFSYSALRNFLNSANIGVLDTSQHIRSTLIPQVLLDEREDPIRDTNAVRPWDTARNDGYLLRAPRGNIKYSEVINLRELLERLSERRIQPGKERRTLFLPDITSNCMIILAATVPIRTAPSLRSFFHHYIKRRPLFSVSKDAMFELEFHIPYFAIRRDGNAVDNRTFEGGRLRKAVRLPLPRTELEEMSHYYEVNISLLVIGVDDWLWTSYFLVDTYHGSEPQKLKYLNDRSPREPATAGTKSLDFPLWCPREFFITVLNVRFNQAVREFRATIDAFDGRMSEYKANSIFCFIDDRNQSRAKELKLTLLTLHDFLHCITATVQAWDAFKAQDMEVFKLPPTDPRYPRWNSYLSDIQQLVRELKQYELLLTHRIKEFKWKEDSLSKISNLNESSTVSRQGDFLKVLTLMTVCYLPFGLSTSIFSMSMIPKNVHWAWFAAVLLGLSVITALVTSHSGILDRLNSSDRLARAGEVEFRGWNSLKRIRRFGTGA